jgi:NADH-quinone oxidoreductase subunit N
MDANNSIAIILPGIVLAGAALLVFIVDLVVDRKGVLAWVAAGGLLAAAAVAVGQWLALGGGFGGRDPEAGFAGMVALDRYGAYCVVLFAAVGILTIMLSDAYMARRRAARGEFYGLLLLIMTGMIGMAVSTDIISFFVSFELMSLPTYVLAGYLWRDRRSGEASLKYFVTGAFSSAILAFGLALVYGATGETNYAAIAQSLPGLAEMDARGLLVVALVLVVTGFGFKISAVPFHSWAPDVYQGAPTPVTAFMSVGVKAAAFVGFARLFVVALDIEWAIWGNMMIILAVLTMVVGNVLALPQRDLKRMLAHAGYLALGLIAAGRSENEPGLAAILFYLAAYVFMNLGAFGVLIWIRGRGTYSYSLDEMGGLARTMPWAGIFMAFFMISLTGIPPTIGFWGKFYLFTAVVQGGYTWLAIVAVLMSTVSAYYYLRVVWYMYFREASQPAASAIDQPQAGDALPESPFALEAPVVATFPPGWLDEEPAPAAAVAAGASPGSATAALAERVSVASEEVEMVPAMEPVAIADGDRPQRGVIAAVTIAAVGVMGLGLFPEPLIRWAEQAVRIVLGG